MKCLRCTGPIVQSPFLEVRLDGDPFRMYFVHRGCHRPKQVSKPPLTSDDVLDIWNELRAL